MPLIHVYAAPQRNQYSARGISCGTTAFLEAASYVLATCALTKLKNQRWPIHITPASTWIQRKIRLSHSETFGSIHPPGICARTLASGDGLVEGDFHPDRLGVVHGHRDRSLPQPLLPD